MISDPKNPADDEGDDKNKPEGGEPAPSPQGDEPSDNPEQAANSFVRRKGREMKPSRNPGGYQTR